MGARNSTGKNSTDLGDKWRYTFKLIFQNLLSRNSNEVCPSISYNDLVMEIGLMENFT